MCDGFFFPFLNIVGTSISAKKQSSIGRWFNKSLNHEEEVPLEGEFELTCR